VSEQGAGLHCSDCLSIEATGCTFTSLTAGTGAGLYLSAFDVSPQTYHYRDCVFSGLVGDESGAALLIDVSVEFYTCQFLNNSANTGSGGAISLQCPTKPEACHLHVSQSVFKDNKAEIQGGSIAWLVSKPELLNNLFEGGKALYGPDVASFAVSISLKAISGNASLETSEVDDHFISVEGTIWNVASGQALDTNLTVAMLDHYGQVVYTENEDTGMLAAAESSANAIGALVATARGGFFVFHGFGLSAQPGSVAKIYVTSAKIIGSGQASGNSTKKGKVGVKLEMRHCIIGESLTGKDCVTCSEGRFNLEAGATCQPCPPEALCYGNYTIVPRAGYWRTHYLSPTFFACPNDLACLGSPDPPEKLSLTGECALGYYGNLCNGCSNQYSRQNLNECQLCPNLTTNILRSAGIGIGVIIVLIVTIRTAIVAARKPRSYYAIYIKILLNYLQLVMLTSSFQMRWPSYMEELFNIQRSAGNATEQVFAIDCFFSGTTDSQATSVRMKLVAMALAPFIILCIALVIWLPVALIRRRIAYLTNEMTASIVICFFLVHPSIVKFVFSFLYCRELDPGQYWLNDFLNIPCWDATHYRYVLIVAVPSLVGWGASVPLVCLLVLYRNRNRLGLMEFKVRLGFVYNGYEYSKFYWEFVILYRKLLIASISVFLTNISSSIQALTVMSVLVVAFGLQAKHKPYALPILNGLELRAILVGGVTIYCGMFYMTSALDANTQLVLFFIIVGVNIYFLVCWTLKVFAAALQIVRSKCPCLMRWLQSTGYQVQPQALSPVKISSVFSRTPGDSVLGESQDLSHVSGYLVLRVRGNFQFQPT